MQYMVFFGLDPDQGFSDQLEGDFVWGHPINTLTKFRILGCKKVACQTIPEAVQDQDLTYE